MSYLEKIGIDNSRITVSRSRQSKPIKQRVLDSIKSEISLIRQRDDLTLQKVNKTIDGVVKQLNENRFWKFDSSQLNKVVFNIKVKGKIFGFGEEVDRHNPKYFVCDNDKDKLIEMLEDFKSKMETIDESETDFWFLGSKPNNVNEVEKTEEVVEKEVV